MFGEITVTCTNTDRIVFPESGITKGDVIAYYRDVAEVMVPELRGRPLTIERFTKGIDQGGFFQKHAQKHYPAWIAREELGTKKKVVYPICDSAAALVYFANQGGFVLHVWTSRRDAPEHPDELVFDLDPPDGRFDLVQQTARLLHELFDQLSLPAFVKTTGSKGLHVVAPLDGRASFGEVATLCDRMSKLLCAARAGSSSTPCEIPRARRSSPRIRCVRGQARRCPRRSAGTSSTASRLTGSGCAMFECGSMPVATHGIACGHALDRPNQRHTRSPT